MIEYMGKMGSSLGQGRVSYLYKLIEDGEIFLGARGVTGYIGEVGLSSISLPELCSESDSTEIAVPLPLFNRKYCEEVRLGVDLGDRLYKKVEEGCLGGEESWRSWDSFAPISYSKYSLSNL